MLRAKGVPARARYGFGAYFNPPKFEEHVVCEVWNETEQRWVLVDLQFDEIWRRQLGIEHDVLDLPRDRYLVAAEAWRRCRSGDADAARFGIFVGELRGLWFIAGELIRDVAALNKREMLPWDVWGAMPGPSEPIDEEHLAFFDRLAALTQSIETVRRGGTLSITGVYVGALPLLPIGELFDRQLTIRMGQANVRRWTDEIIPLLDDGDPLGTEDLATHHLPLTEAPRAYEMFQKKLDGAIKVVLRP
jgi:threonine dehydrogenase-like Zn-dependent dehydrogenase